MTKNSYDYQKHAKFIEQWLTARDLLVGTNVRDLPEIGIVITLDHPIAAGFIRKVEGGYGLIDGYITDPSASPLDRHNALELLTTSLIEKAQELKFKGLLAFTKDNHTLLRSLSHGFSETHSYLVGLNLSGDNQ